MDRYFKANPDKLRELQERANENFLATKQKTGKKAVARRRSGSTVTKKVHSAKKTSPRTFDNIEDELDRRGGWGNMIPDLDEED